MVGLSQRSILKIVGKLPLLLVKTLMTVSSDEMGHSSSVFIARVTLLSTLVLGAQPTNDAIKHKLHYKWRSRWEVRGRVSPRSEWTKCQFVSSQLVS